MSSCNNSGCGPSCGIVGEDHNVKCDRYFINLGS